MKIYSRSRPFSSKEKKKNYSYSFYRNQTIVVLCTVDYGPCGCISVYTIYSFNSMIYVAVALAYSLQIMDEGVVPVTPTDVLIDALVSPSGVIPISPAATEKM